MSRVFSIATGRGIGKTRAQRLAAEGHTLSKDYGIIVNRERTRLGLSVPDLARRTELDETYLSELESAVTLRSPTLEIMYRIARALRKHPAELLPITGVVQ